MNSEAVIKIAFLLNLVLHKQKQPKKTYNYLQLIKPEVKMSFFFFLSTKDG